MEQVKPIRNHPKANKVKTFPSFDAQKLINEDKLNEGLNIPFRFGKGFDTNITLNEGEWIDVEGGRLWTMEFQSKGAYSINFVFNQFYLPDSAELYITNASGTVLYGPVTSKENTKNGYFLTDLIQGDDVTIYLFEPKDKNGESQLTIQKVVHAYKNQFPLSYGNLGGSGSCNNDIACFPPWDEESDAVALVLLASGAEQCSGSLVMTAGQTFEPYFLSAFHCIDDPIAPNGSLSATEISNAENWMFKFQYKMTSCGGSTATTGITYNGATFRAAWNSSDFALMEMDNSPLGDSRFSWLGWDRSGNTPTSGTGIHHPSGDVMKISFDNDAIPETSEGSTSTGTSHWYVDIDNGTLEAGSSGSPLFNENRRIVGQLHSGYPGCSSSKQFWYGCFHRSWTGGGTNTTSLSNWLDPCGSGVVTTNTARPPYLSGPDVVAEYFSFYSIQNFPSGSTISWTHSDNITQNCSQGSTFCEFEPNGSVSAPGWIGATIINACDSIILPRKIVWVGVPDYTQLGIELQNGYLTACDYTSGTAKYMGTAWPEIDAYEWYMPNASDWTIEEESFSGIDNKYVEIHYWEDPAPYQEDIYIRAHNSCGWSDWKHTIWSVTDNCYGLLMILSPNPATGETTLTIQSPTKQKKVDIIEEWELEVFDQAQVLKAKTSKLKGNCTTIQTSNWKDGVYIVRAKIGDEIITEKLVVKH